MGFARRMPIKPGHSSYWERFHGDFRSERVFYMHSVLCLAFRRRSARRRTFILNGRKRPCKVHNIFIIHKSRQKHKPISQKQNAPQGSASLIFPHGYVMFIIRLLCRFGYAYF